MRDLNSSWSFSGIASSCAGWRGVAWSRSTSTFDDEELTEPDVPCSLVSPSDVPCVVSEKIDGTVCVPGIFLAT